MVMILRKQSDKCFMLYVFLAQFIFLQIEIESNKKLLQFYLEKKDKRV